jgi:hypothetical protein
MTESVVVTEVVNSVVVSSPGAQGPAGRTILNGVGSPASNLGVTGDFYYNTENTDFYGPKLSDLSWSGATIVPLAASGSDYALAHSWEIGQVTGPVSDIYSLTINHNLGFMPNVTVKTSSGDVLETGINYNSSNTITLTMAQPFSGTAYLS